MVNKKITTKETKGFAISSSYMEGISEQQKPIAYEDLYDFYKVDADIFAIIQKIQAGVISNGWDIIYLDDKNQDESSRDFLLTFFENANPEETFNETLKECVMHLAITGDNYWNLITNAFGDLIGIVTLNPATMTIMGDNHGQISGYVQKYMGDEAQFEVEEMAHFKLPNPTNDFYGLSPLYPLRYEVETDLAAMLSNYNFFKNDATPRSIWDLPDTMSDKDFEKAQKDIQANSKGVKNRNRTIVTRGLKDVKVLTPTMQEMEFQAMRKLSTEKKCSVYSVPKVMIGYTENSTYNNAKTMMRDFYQNAIQPYQTIIPAFGIESCEFKFNPMNFEEREIINKDADQGFITGMYSMNEARQMKGLEPLDPAVFGDLGTKHFVMAQGNLIDIAEFSSPQALAKSIHNNLIGLKAKLARFDERDSKVH